MELKHSATKHWYDLHPEKIPPGKRTKTLTCKTQLKKKDKQGAKSRACFTCIFEPGEGDTWLNWCCQHHWKFTINSDLLPISSHFYNKATVLPPALTCVSPQFVSYWVRPECKMHTNILFHPIVLPEWTRFSCNSFCIASHHAEVAIFSNLKV